MSATTTTSPPAAGTAAKTEPKKSAVDALHDRVNAIFGKKNGLSEPQLRKLNGYIDQLADKYNLRQPNYKAYNSDMDAVLRLYRDKGLVGHDASKSTWGGIIKPGVDPAFLKDDNYLKMLAAASVKGFVLRSDAPGEQKDYISSAMDTEMGNAIRTAPAAEQAQWTKLYSDHTNVEAIGNARNKMTNSGFINTTVRVGALAVGTYGLISSIKSFFSSKKPDGEQKGFWNRMGELLQVGAFAYATYNFGIKGRGVGETYAATSKVIGKWTSRIVGEQKPAVSFVLNT